MMEIFRLFLLGYFAGLSYQIEISPILLVPGYGGSRIEAKLVRNNTEINCKSESDWFTIWLNVPELLLRMNCFSESMQLNYNPENRTTYNAPGVQVRTAVLGDPNYVEWLDKEEVIGKYFHSIVDYLVSNFGYERDISILGAPYDFRKAPNEMSDYFAAFKRLVEESYSKNGNKSVTLLGHSMGNLYILYFLNQQEKSWKDQYIRSFISIAAPYGGSVITMRLMASGVNPDDFLILLENLGITKNQTKLFRAVERSSPSSAWLMPYDRFWTKDEVLVYTPARNYTVNDYKRFFDDIQFPIGYSMRQDTEPLIKNLEPPGVAVHCIYGMKVKTPEALNYTHSEGNWFDFEPEVINGDGDGTVNLRSLQICQKWNETQNAKVDCREFEGVSHLGILANDEVKAYIGTLVVLSSSSTTADLISLYFAILSAQLPTFFYSLYFDMHGF